MATKPGYQIQYRSRKDLEEDVRTYLGHGGVSVPWLVKLPAVNSDIAVRVVTTFDATRVEFPARVIQHMPGVGFMATFEDKAAKKTLADHVAEDAFVELLVKEPGRPNSRLVTPFEVEIEAPKRFEKKAEPPASVPPPAPAHSDLASLEEDETKPSLSALSDDMDDLGLELPEIDEAPEKPAEEPRPSAAAKPSDEAELEGEDDVANEEEYMSLAAEEATGDESDEEKPTFAHPGPGEKFIVYVLKFPSVLDYVDVTQTLRDDRKFQVEVEEAAAGGRPVKVGNVVHLRVQLPGRNVFQMFAEVLEVQPKRVTVRANPGDPELEKACAFPRTLTGKKRLAKETDSDRGPTEVLRFMDQRSAEEENAGPIRVRLKRMSMEDKINLALSGGREERMALAMDTNKAIPHYVLRNAKITLDEIAFMSRLPSMNPDVLNKIADNTTYVQNSQVVRNLVFNPKTPITTAVRLLDRLPKNELMLLAKRTSMNQRLVQAAKKKTGIK
ncbi:MAG: hypothetical protein HY791_29045 [Deltaproteobacteria bacterium]|nr:hypothetical protein [Deltaproteobacteria bacterium]